MTTTPKYVNHATVQTGDVTPIWQWQVGAEAITHLMGQMDSALTGGRPVVIGDVMMTAEQSGKNLIATLWRDGDPILTVAICVKSRAGPPIWAMMHDSATPPAPVNQADRPPAPWILSRLEPAITTADARWTGDFGNCLGWAWLEYVR